MMIFMQRTLAAPATQVKRHMMRVRNRFTRPVGTQRQEHAASPGTLRSTACSDLKVFFLQLAGVVREVLAIWLPRNGWRSYSAYRLADHDFFCEYARGMQFRITVNSGGKARQ